LDDGEAEAMPGAHLAQQLWGAAAAVAEGAVMADDDMGQPNRAEHDLLDKGFGALLRETRVEMLDEQQLDPEPRDLALLDPERGQPIGLAAGHEDAARMRLEGQHAGRLAGGMGALAGRPDQRRVPQMQPVKIAHRQDRAARMGGSGTG